MEADKTLTLWIDVEDHLRFAEQVLEHAELDGLAISELQTQITKLRTRANDPTFYLAVVGEYDAGKSTFVNALLGEPLLRTSHLPTTGVAARLRPGEALDAEIRFTEAAESLRYREASSRLWQRLRPLAPDIIRGESDIRRFIDLVSGDSRIMAAVSGITIEHPHPLLGKQITIIDTPGLNSEHAHHAEVTRAVLEEEADAAIVVIPAPQTVSLSMAESLGGLLRPYLHRSLFVVTQMGKIRERDQAMVLDRIRLQLMAHFGLQDPAVYATDAQAVLDHLAGDTLMPALAPWPARFEALVLTIRERLQRERVVGITERAIRLLQRLFEQLTRQLGARQTMVRERREAIRREVIQDLDAFAKEQRAIGHEIITQASQRVQRRFTQAVEREESQAQQHLQSAIQAAQSISQLKAVIDNYKLDAARTDLGGEMQGLAHELTHAATQATRALDQRFIQEYQRLESLGEGGTTMNAISAITSMTLESAMVFASAGELVAEWDRRETNLISGGAWGGVLIGATVAGPAGAFVGFFVGGLAGAFFTPPIDEQRRKLWSEIRPNLISAFASAVTQGGKSLDEHERSLCARLDERLAAYVTHYRATVDALLAAQRREAESLVALEHTITTALGEIQHRRALLEDGRTRLAAMGTPSAAGTRNRKEAGA